MSLIIFRKPHRWNGVGVGVDSSCFAVGCGRCASRDGLFRSSAG